MITGPPLTLAEPVVMIIRPSPPAIGVTLPPRAAIDVPWPRCRVTQPRIPGPPSEIRLPAPPQSPWRASLPPVVRDLLAVPLPALAVEPSR